MKWCDRIDHKKGITRKIRLIASIAHDVNYAARTVEFFPV